MQMYLKSHLFQLFQTQIQGEFSFTGKNLSEEDVHQDIMAYLRTVSLQQVEGPRGFQYLKDDLQERVDLRSEGRVSKVMFRTLVIE